MSRPKESIVIGIAALALVGVLLAGQAATDALVPAGRSSTGRSLGRTSMAFLSGLRTFGAELLWNRLDPQFHEYYSGKPLAMQTFIMPTIWMVVTLDPQFIQAYYLAPYVLMKSGHVDEGWSLAREGVRNNPTSGVLLGSYAELLLVVKKDPRAAAKESDLMLAKGVYWSSPLEEWQALTTARDAYKDVGRKADSLKVVERMQALDKVIEKLPKPTATEHLDDTNYGK